MKITNALSVAILVGFSVQAAAQEPHTDSTRLVENLGPPINTEYAERFSMISPDGLTLYFSSNRPDGLGEANGQGQKAWDMYVAWRENVVDPFGEAVNLGQNVNSPYRDHSASFSDDGHWMYFGSDRPGGCGGYDLYVSYREDTTDPLGWQAAEHLGCTLNTEFDEACPIPTTDKVSGRPLLYLVRNSVSGEINMDIYVSEGESGTRQYQSPLPITSLNTPVHDAHFDPRHGLVWSYRDGGYGGGDLWQTTPLSESREWSPPQNLGPSINTEHDEELPSATSDGWIFFPSNRPGGYGSYDIYLASPIDH